MAVLTAAFIAVLVAVLATWMGVATHAVAAPPAASPGEGSRAPTAGVSWVRELELSDVGGANDTLFAASDGGVWLAVTGETAPEGRARVYRRDPTTHAWTQLWEGPTATDLRFQEAPDTRVALSMGHPLQGFRPRMLEFGPAASPAAASELRPPLQRLTDHEYQQVGAMWLDRGTRSWACGQEGALWLLDEQGPWVPQAFPIEGDEQRRGERYCTALHMDATGAGYLATTAGTSAWFDGFSWQAMDRGPHEVWALGATPGMGRADGAFYRAVDDRWVPLENQCEDLDAQQTLATSITLSVGGHVGISREHLLRFGPTGWTCERAANELPVRAVTEVDGAFFVLSEDGVYRSTRERVLRFAPSPLGGLPVGLQYPLVADLDGDGRDEVIAALAPDLAGHPSSQSLGGELAVYRAMGAGEYRRDLSAGPQMRTTLRPGFADVGDLDGDADLDFAVQNMQMRIELWRNEGDHFTKIFETEEPSGRITLVDVEGDGDLDLVNTREILLNNGGGTFTLGTKLEGYGDLSDWADVDGDGDADSVERHWRDNSAFVENRFAQGEGLTFASHPLGRPQETGQFTDFDLDGELELLAGLVHLQYRSIPFAICELGAEPSCETQSAGVVPPGILGDLDRDGLDDLVVGSTRADELPDDAGAVFLRSRAPAQGRALWRDLTYAAGRHPRPTLLDADGDGDLDIYSTVEGLRLNRNDPASWVRFELRAPQSDARAEGTLVRIFNAAGVAVASGRAHAGALVLGLPEPGARYTARVAFAQGEVELEVGAGERHSVRPHVGAASLLARLRSWFAITWTRAKPARDMGLPMLGMLGAGFIFWRRQTRGRGARGDASRSSVAKGLGGPQGEARAGEGPRQTLWTVGAWAGLCALAWVAWVGSFVRATGGLPWLLGLVVLASAGLAMALGWGITRARARRYAGPYRLVEAIGRGAAATVWHARRSQKDIALKLFDAGLLESSDSRERFFREAKIGNEIQSDYLVRVDAFGALDDGRCYLAMELIRGGSLAERLREGAIGWREAFTVGADVAQGLHELHGAGAIHRDLKPANILLREDGRALVADLGLARSELAKTITRHELAVGTLAYMSPEQAIGAPLDGRSDLWALGVVLYEATTGRLPFAAEHELELLHLIHNVEPNDPRGFAPELPAEAADFVMGCLSRKAQGRPSDARAARAEMLALLERFAS